MPLRPCAARPPEAVGDVLPEEATAEVALPRPRKPSPRALIFIIIAVPVVGPTHLMALGGPYLPLVHARHVAPMVAGVAARAAAHLVPIVASGAEVACFVPKALALAEEAPSQVVATAARRPLMARCADLVIVGAPRAVPFEEGVPEARLGAGPNAVALERAA